MGIKDIPLSDSVVPIEPIRRQFGLVGLEVLPDSRTDEAVRFLEGRGMSPDAARRGVRKHQELIGFLATLGR